MTKLSDENVLLAACVTALVIAFPILNFYVWNQHDNNFSPTVYWRFAAIFAGISAAIAVAGAFSIRRWLSGIGVARFLLAFSALYLVMFLFKVVQDGFESLLQPIGYASKAGYGFVAIALIAVSLTFWLAKYRAFHVAALVFALMSIGQSLWRVELVGASGSSSERSEPEHLTAAGTSKQRNIYYVVVDEHASSAVLKDIVGIDLRPFIADMESRGFFHAHQARSSYTVTHLTFSSLLIGNYPFQGEIRADQRATIYPALLVGKQPPPVIATLKAIGYETYWAGNGYARCVPAHMKCLVVGDDSDVKSIVQAFLVATPIPLVQRSLERKQFRWQALAWHPWHVDAIGDLLEVFRKSDVPPSPAFVFVHHLPPHVPYVFDGSCQSRKVDPYRWKESNQKLYGDQVRCVSRRLKEFADFVITRDPDAIVIFQGDHGTDFRVDWLQPLNAWPSEAVEERVSILNLIRAPMDCAKWLRPDLGSVNTMLFAIGCATGRPPDYLPERSFLSTWRPEARDFGKVVEVGDGDRAAGIR